MRWCFECILLSLNLVTTYHKCIIGLKSFFLVWLAKCWMFPNSIIKHLGTFWNGTQGILLLFVTSHYSVIENVCLEVLRIVKNFIENYDSDEYEYADLNWWCTSLGYKTIDHSTRWRTLTIHLVQPKLVLEGYLKHYWYLNPRAL